jgi:GAF domain-containing protein
MMDNIKPDWQSLARQAHGLLSVTRDRVANAANLSAFIFHELPDLSWVGFYFLQGDTLILGPFQGKPACVSIPMGRGVCGVSAETRKIHRVADVDTFDGHIACDADSRSELVIPLVKDGNLLAVLDLDSTTLERFSSDDETGFAKLAQVYLDSID